MAAPEWGMEITVAATRSRRAVTPERPLNHGRSRLTHVRARDPHRPQWGSIPANARGRTDESGRCRAHHRVRTPLGTFPPLAPDKHDRMTSLLLKGAPLFSEDDWFG